MHWRPGYYLTDTVCILSLSKTSPLVLIGDANFNQLVKMLSGLPIDIRISSYFHNLIKIIYHALGGTKNIQYTLSTIAEFEK